MRKIRVFAVCGKNPGPFYWDVRIAAVVSRRQSVGAPVNDAEKIMEVLCFDVRTFFRLVLSVV